MKQFPEFFTSKDPIQTNVIPLKFGNNIYWMSTLATADDDYTPRTYLKPYEDNEEGLLDCGDLEENYDIVLTKSGKFMTSMYVPSSLLSHIVGAKASKLKSLQKSTNTIIKVPRQDEKGDVKITGDTERKVASARTQISLIVFRRKDKLPVSHFVSIPVKSDSVKNGLKKFQEEILKNPPKGVTQSLFQKPEKLHLTISTLTLLDEEETNFAKKTLQNCYMEVVSKLFDRSKKNIIVRGIEIMNDDPSEVNVLYACVQMKDEKQTKNLQDMADKIAEYFYRAGLARKQYDRVKLHVTLMNSVFRNSDEEPGKFDATNILKNYKDFCFGETELTNIQLSVRFTSGDDKYYDSILTLPI